MNRRVVFLAVLALLGTCAGPIIAQQTLGDFVALGGYDWILGRWSATTDEGQKVQFQYDWVLDKHAVRSTFEMGPFHQHGLVMLPSGGEEVVDVGADNRGGLWKGTWYEEAGELVHRIEHTDNQGQVRKADVVHNMVDRNTMTVALYTVDNSGYRTGQTWGKLTYKRQPVSASAASVSAASSTGMTDYVTLGDLIAQGGYEWLIGKWVAADGGSQYELEYKSLLDGHSALVNVTIGDFKYEGMIMYAPSREEITQVGADNMGGTWKGTWAEDYEGAVNRNEYTKSDGTMEKTEHVYSKVNNDALKVKLYGVESGGWRAAQPRGEMTFKRQK